jgi:hypothetical protein
MRYLLQKAFKAQHFGDFWRLGLFFGFAKIYIFWALEMAHEKLALACCRVYCNPCVRSGIFCPYRDADTAEFHSGTQPCWELHALGLP